MSMARLCLVTMHKLRLGVKRLQNHGVPFKHVRPLIGKGGDQVVPELVPGLTDQDGKGKTVANRCKELILNRYAPSLASANGSRALVLQMQAVGLQVVIASSTTKAELAMFLKISQIEGMIQKATTSSNTEESKPAPDIVSVALDKLNLEPSQVSHGWRYPLRY